MRKILFRADGSTEIGLGHVIRSLALAEMLKDDFYIVFAIQEPSELLQQQIIAVCSEIIVLPRTDNRDNLLKELESFLQGDEVVVLDGYKFETDYQKTIKNKGCKLVCIDDIHAYHLVADIVINHGIDTNAVYSRESCTKLLLGTDYCLLRQPFLQPRESDFIPNKENNIFLCFGGSDITNLTCAYLERLVKIEGLGIIHVVVGSAFQHEMALLQLLDQKNDSNIQVHRNVSSQELVRIIQNCNVAIVPGSTIAIECASIGIPILCGYYADNQHDIVQTLERLEIAVNFGDFTLFEESVFAKKLKKLLKTDAHAWHKRSKQFFDGRAKERFLKEFKSLFLLREIEIRRALKSDVNLYYHWANDPIVRLYAINEEPIPYDSHCAWFINKLSSIHSYLYIAVVNGKDFGQVRFDFEDGNFYISYSVSCEMLGRGLATPMLEAAIQQLQKDFKQTFTLLALVKENNTASSKVFKRLQFDSREGRKIGAIEYKVFEKPFFETKCFDSTSC
jgi:UDP-2,4-diacetamido-2,4,6-trideoxy-beta-L-altropyranose hydrolase